MSWVIVFCSFLGAFCLITGLLIGMTWERHLAERACVDQAEAEADEYIEQLRPLPSERPTERTRVAIDYRPAPIPGLGTPIWVRQQEEWERHEETALALVRDDLTDSAYTADMAARMDRFLEGLARVPYSADELWSGQ